MNTQRPRFALPRPVPPGRWRRVPPAIFPPILGALALALAWRGGGEAFALPPGAADMMAGIAVAIFGFAAFAYGAKLARRPGVVVEDLAVLPGQAGVAAAVLSVDLAAALIADFAPVAGRVLLVLGLALHPVLIVLWVRALRAGPAERRQVAPVWHLVLTGLAVAAWAALAAGWPGVAAALFWPALGAGVAIHAASAAQARRQRVPAPLRPLLAIHLAPVALFAILTLGLGGTAAGTVLTWLALAGLVLAGVAARWLLAAGFSALWGPLGFPAAATAGAWVSLWHADPSEVHRLVAGAVLVAATLIVVPVLVLTLRDWARGRLPTRTNAAIA